MKSATGKVLVLLLPLALMACSATSSRSSSDQDPRRAQASRVNVELGAGYLRRGNYELALEKLQKALDFDPKNVVALTTLAVLYEQLGDTKQAEKHHRMAIKAAPDDANAQNNYGAFLCKVGDYRDSEKHFMKAATNPFYQNPEVALANAGRCLARIPDWAGAEQHLRDALEYNSDYTEALYALSEVKYQQKDFFKARAFLQRYEADAEPTAASLLLGYRIERSLQRPAQAAIYARQLQQQFPNTAQATELDNDEPAS